MSDDLGLTRGIGLNVHAKAWNSDGASASEEPREKTICTFFAMGGCRKGSGCPYSHDLTQEAPAGVDASGGFYISGRVANLNPSAPAPNSSSSSLRQVSPTTSLPPPSGQPQDRLPQFSVSGAPQQPVKSNGYGYAQAPQQQQQLGGFELAGSIGISQQQQNVQQQQQQYYGNYLAAGGPSPNQVPGRPDYDYDPQQQPQQYFPSAAYNAPPHQQPLPQADMPWQAPPPQQGLVSIGYQQQGPSPTAGYDMNGNPVLYMPQAQPQQQQQQQQQQNGLRMIPQQQQGGFVEQQQWATTAAMSQQPAAALQQGIKYIPMAAPAGPSRQQTPLSPSSGGGFASSPTAGYVSYAAFGRDSSTAPFSQQLPQQPQQQQYSQQPTYAGVNGSTAVGQFQYAPNAFKNMSPVVQNPNGVMQPSFQPYPQPQQQQQQQALPSAVSPVSAGYHQLQPPFSHQQQQAAFFNNEFITSNYMTSQPQFQAAPPAGMVAGDYPPNGSGAMDAMSQLQPQDGGMMQQHSASYLPQQQQQASVPQQQQQWNNGNVVGVAGSPFLPPSTSFSTSTLFRSADLFPPVAAAPPALAGNNSTTVMPGNESSRAAPQVPRSIDSEDLPLPAARRQAMPAAPMPLQ